MAKLIDTHIHLDDAQYDGDRDEIIAQFFASGGEALINVGAGLGSSARSVALAKSHENIFAAVGFHPHYFNEYKEKSFDRVGELESLAKDERVVAIGEIGLDYFSHTDEPIDDRQKELQKKGFEHQLDLAKKLHLPVIIHCRGTRSEAGSKFRETIEAYDDALEVIKKFLDLKYVFHGYGGNLEFSKKILGNDNMKFSFNGNITYAKPNAEIFEVIRLIPIERIMVETDGPYLTPVPFRGKRNDPIYVKYVIGKLAEVKDMEPSEVERVTEKNAIDFFGKLAQNR